MNGLDLIVRGGTVVMAEAMQTGDIGVSGGLIVEIADEITGAAREVIDARGLHVLPGGIDIHVHFNEPGRTGWEGWATGSAACAVGGTAIVADMPLNAHPPTLDGASFDAKRQAATARSLVDFALWGGLTPINLDRLEELAARGVIGFKAFMANSGMADFPAANDHTLQEGMASAAALGLPVAVHAEDEVTTARLTAEAIAAGRTDARAYLASRPVSAEIDAIARAIRFAEETRCALHIAHVSTGAGVALVAEAQARGADVSAETCPHYLLFDEDDLERLGAVAKCAPPLRSSADIDALWGAIADGSLPIAASDHSPAPWEMKSGSDIFAIWGGISGCQSLLSALLSSGHIERAIALPTLARALASNPANRVGLQGRGRIAPGFSADLALVDLLEPVTLDRASLRYRHQHSPFLGTTFTCRVRRTLLRGQTIAMDGQTRGAAHGQLLRPASSAAP